MLGGGKLHRIFTSIDEKLNDSPHNSTRQKQTIIIAICICGFYGW